MANLISATGESGDLFGGLPVTRDQAVTRHQALTGRRRAPALTAARVLCRQLRRKQARPDKQRIAHLICLSLVSMLKDASQRARQTTPARRSAQFASSIVL